MCEKHNKEISSDIILSGGWSHGQLESPLPVCKTSSYHRLQRHHTKKEEDEDEPGWNHHSGPEAAPPHGPSPAPAGTADRVAPTLRLYVSTRMRQGALLELS